MPENVFLSRRVWTSHKLINRGFSDIHISDCFVLCLVYALCLARFLVLSCGVLSWGVLSCGVLSCLVGCCRVVSCRVVSCRVVVCLVLSYLILSYLASSYLVLCGSRSSRVASCRVVCLKWSCITFVGPSHDQDQNDGHEVH